jgi:uncharacterized iron-regulated membrane protein
MPLTRARRWNPWREVVGVLPLAVAVGLWVVVVAGVTAPLGDALARLEAPRPSEALAHIEEPASDVLAHVEEPKPGTAPPACAIPPDAIASAVRPPPPDVPVSCRREGKP